MQQYGNGLTTPHKRQYQSQKQRKENEVYQPSIAGDVHNFCDRTYQHHRERHAGHKVKLNGNSRYFAMKFGDFGLEP